MGDNENKGDRVNDAIHNAHRSIEQTMNGLGDLMNSIIPKGVQKEITIEVVEKKGFFGWGRKIKKVKATAYISMNNILNMDFQDKNEMKKYFDELK